MTTVPQQAHQNFLYNCGNYATLFANVVPLTISLVSEKQDLSKWEKHYAAWTVLIGCGIGIIWSSGDRDMVSGNRSVAGQLFGTIGPLMYLFRLTLHLKLVDLSFENFDLKMLSKIIPPIALFLFAFFKFRGAFDTPVLLTMAALTADAAVSIYDHFEDGRTFGEDSDNKE